MVPLPPLNVTHGFIKVGKTIWSWMILPKCLNIRPMNLISNRLIYKCFTWNLNENTHWLSRIGMIQSAGILTFDDDSYWCFINNLWFWHCWVAAKCRSMHSFTSWSWFSNIQAHCGQHSFGPFSMSCPILGKRLPAMLTIGPNIEIVPNTFSHRYQRKWLRTAVQWRSLAKTERNWRTCQSNKFSMESREKNGAKLIFLKNMIEAKVSNKSCWLRIMNRFRCVLTALLTCNVVNVGPQFAFNVLWNCDTL